MKPILLERYLPATQNIALDTQNRDEEYQVELSLFPTDVINHYSGYPLSR